jgi:predicted N-acetyltransferase YhbS
LNKKVSDEKVRVRNYVSDDEQKIEDLLNKVFVGWGNLEKWRYTYKDYPTFTDDDIVVAEDDGKIVGHGGVRARALEVKEAGRILTGLLGDAAVLPDYRRRGIYSEILRKRLSIARSRGASLAFMWVTRGSIAHRTAKKSGFIEVNQTPAYVRILNAEKVVRGALIDLLKENHRLRAAMQKLEVDLCLCLAGKEIHIRELLNGAVGEGKSAVRADILLGEGSLSTLVNFRAMSRPQKIASLLHLLISRKVRIKPYSMSAFFGLVSATVHAARVL